MLTDCHNHSMFLTLSVGRVYLNYGGPGVGWFLNPAIRATPLVLLVYLVEHSYTLHPFFPLKLLVKE